MEGIPQELQLNFVSENVPHVCTDEPDMDLPSPIEHLAVEKQPIEVETIFDKEIIEDTLPSVEKVIENPIAESQPPPKKQKEKPVKLNKDGKPRKKRNYTDEQRQAMRERMLKVRAESGKNKAKREEQKAKEKKYKELMEKKKELEMEEVEQKLKKKSQPKEEPTPVIHQNIGISKEDLQKAQFEAIVQYETLRKKRKEKKKQEAQIKQYNEDVRTNLKKELSWREVAGPYANCF
jgi:hypothetical protein